MQRSSGARPPIDARRDQNREPQTGRLADRTLHCPPSGSRHHGEAYWAGWVDGRFRETGSFVNNPNLALRGHRTGREARRRGERSKAHKRSWGVPDRSA
jgi:hypothetical protein